MRQHPLKIIQIEKKVESSLFSPSNFRKTQIDLQQARAENEWLQNRNNLDPDSNPFEKQRIEKTSQFIQKLGPLQEISALDIGCGEGSLSRFLHSQGACVEALDVSREALNLFRIKGSENIYLNQDCFPYTKQNDRSYDLILCCDVLAELNPKDFRIAISELRRLIKAEGTLICSTPVMTNSIDAIARFLDLIQSEFEIHEIEVSYHRLFQSISSTFDTFFCLQKSIQSMLFRKEQIQKRKGLKKRIFAFLSRPAFRRVWEVLEHPSSIIQFFLKKKKVINFLENTSKFYYGEYGITHVLLSAKPKKFQF